MEGIKLVVNVFFHDSVSYLFSIVVLREDMLKKSEIDIAHLKASNEGKVDT